MDNIRLDNEWMIYNVGDTFSLKKLCLKTIVKHTPARPFQIHYNRINKLMLPICLKNELCSSLYSELWLNLPKFESKFIYTTKVGNQIDIVYQSLVRTQPVPASTSGPRDSS